MKPSDYCGQTRPDQSDLVTLTFPDTSTAVAVIVEPVAYKGFGKVIRGSFTVKKADSATY